MKLGLIADDRDRDIQMRALCPVCDEVVVGDMTLLLSRLSPSDVVLVWRIDKLGRSLDELSKRIKDVHSAGAEVRFLHEHVSSRDLEVSQLIEVMRKLEV
ncbi:recombinase family protein [Vibrio vulnificus]|uniref:recombinase family protein n=1 Tax=Vibrio vulnificus TaxID=672 RepID=UPI001A1ED466|nr:recombinase family protein [Vibrio vulnificus]MCJ0806687.1 recombinase family protein [Vibrio vulnificus]HAS6087720.1 hypothetical protein [Vibrio vulnificus]